jgi:hypothetical protein
MPDGRAKTAYLEGELCGVGADGLPNFAETQAATDREPSARLVFYAFDLPHRDGRDTARLPLVERKAPLKPVVADIPGLQFNGHELATANLSAAMPVSSAMRASCLRRLTHPKLRAIAAYGAKRNVSTGKNLSWSDGPIPKDRGHISERGCSGLLHR